MSRGEAEPLAKIYAGKPPGLVVVIDDEREVGRPLRHHRLHSPDGFSWGFNGSGPSDLARSLLWDALGEEPRPACYEAFRIAFVAQWHSEQPWRLTDAKIAEWVAGYRSLCRPGWATVREEQEAAAL